MWGRFGLFVGISIVNWFTQPCDVKLYESSLIILGGVRSIRGRIFGIWLPFAM